MPIDPLPADLVSLPEGISPRPPDNSPNPNEHKKLLQSLSLGLPGTGGEERFVGKSRTHSLKVKEPGIKESLSSSKINDLKGMDQNTLDVSPPALSRSLKSLDIAPQPRAKVQGRRNRLGDSEQSLEKKKAHSARSNGATNGKSPFGDGEVNYKRDEDDDDSIVYGQTEEELEEAKLQAAREVKKAEEAEVKMYVHRSSIARSESLPVIMTAQEVCEAAIELDNSSEYFERIELYKVSILFKCPML